MRSPFEQHKEALLDWVRMRAETSAKWHKYAIRHDPLVRRFFEASDHVKSELRRHRLFGCFERDWAWPRMDCAHHITLHAPYLGICECAAPRKFRRFSGLSSSCIGLSASQVVLSFGDGAYDVAGVSGLNSLGEDKSMVFKT